MYKLILLHFKVINNIEEDKTIMLKLIEKNYLQFPDCTVISAHLDHHSGKDNYGFILMFHWKYFLDEYQYIRSS